MTLSQVHDEPLSLEQIDALPVYEWTLAHIGDQAPPFTYPVTETSIAEYCAAVRNTNPLYLDAAAARQGPFGGIIAPPTYIFKCAPHRRNEVMHARGYASPEEKGLRATPYAKAEVFFVRPIRPGDEITSTNVLEEKFERRGSQFMTWRTRAVDGAGVPVVEYTYTTIWHQGQAGDSGGPRPATPSGRAVSPPLESLPTLVKIESQEAIDQYAALARGRPRHGQSLHSDPDFARRTIFGGTVNMGVATAAYCSELLERQFGPAALLQPGARLEYKGIRPIRAGYEISIGADVLSRSDTSAECQLSVHNQQGLLCGVGNATLVLG